MNSLDLTVRILPEPYIQFLLDEIGLYVRDFLRTDVNKVLLPSTNMTDGNFNGYLEIIERIFLENISLICSS